MSDRTILAVETSCDETAVSVVRGDFHEANSLPSRVCVLSHVVESQIAVHIPFGGVVPEVAARDHLTKIDGVAQQALADAGMTIQDIDAVAVTMGPGLIGALMVGVLYARGLAFAAGLPLIAVNHVDAHLSPALLLEEFVIGKEQSVPDIPYPALALTVSGGHCHLSLLESPVKRRLLGRTADDACGEAFDKVAKLLGLPYPGGPQIETLAAKASGTSFVFPHTLADKANRYGFSFSGLKTAVLVAVRKATNQKTGKISGANLPEEIKAELALAFQNAALGQLEDRLKNALRDFSGSIKSVVVAGGVAANSQFRERLAQLSVPIFLAPRALCSDNGTMIGLQALLNGGDGFVVQPFTRYLEDPMQSGNS